MKYLQTLHRDSTINDAVIESFYKAVKIGKVTHIEAEVQRNLFSAQEDVFVTLEVENETR